MRWQIKQAYLLLPCTQAVNISPHALHLLVIQNCLHSQPGELVAEGGTALAATWVNTLLSWWSELKLLQMHAAYLHLSTPIAAR